MPRPLCRQGGHRTKTRAHESSLGSCHFLRPTQHPPSGTGAPPTTEQEMFQVSLGLRLPAGRHAGLWRVRQPWLPSLAIPLPGGGNWSAPWRQDLGPDRSSFSGPFAICLFYPRHPLPPPLPYHQPGGGRELAGITPDHLFPRGLSLPLLQGFLERPWQSHPRETTSRCPFRTPDLRTVSHFPD